MNNQNHNNPDINNSDNLEHNINIIEFDSIFKEFKVFNRSNKNNNSNNIFIQQETLDFRNSLYKQLNDIDIKLNPKRLSA